MTPAEREALDTQIAETVETLNRLRRALTKVANAPESLWNSCVGKVGQLKRDLVRLKKRKEE